MDILMVPLGISLIIVILMLLCIFLGMKLNHINDKMIWWRNEACKINANLRNIWNKDAEIASKHKTRAPWLRNLK